MNLKTSTGRRAWYGLAVVLGLAVAVTGFGSSFDNLSTYAEAHGWPYGPALPIGLDLGIPALLILDWLRASLFLRSAAWALAAWTVFANGAVAGGDLIDRLLHAMMPAVAILIVEAARHLRDDPSRMDRIRWSRYLINPVRTVRIRARMISWEITSYAEALRLESAILLARTVLVSEYGERSWRRTRKRAPVILVHDLETGQLPPELFYATDCRPAVRAWVRQTLDELDPRPEPVPAETEAADPVPDPVPEVVFERGPWDRVWDRLDFLDSVGLNDAQKLTAYGLARHHFEQAGRHIVADRLRGPVGIGKAKALTLADALRTAYETEADRRSPERFPDPAADPVEADLPETGLVPAGTAGLEDGLMPSMKGAF